MLYAAKKIFYLEGLYIWLGGGRYFLTPPQLHASTLASSLDLLPQLFRPPSEIGFQLCCSDELSVAAAAQLRVAEGSDTGAFGVRDFLGPVISNGHTVISYFTYSDFLFRRINGKERHLRFYRLYGVGVAPKVCHPRRPTETSKAGRSWAKATAEGRPGKTLFFTGGCSSSHDDFKE